MSVRIQAIVWANSGQKAAPLLMLLAIADMCNDVGESYPGVPHLAKKCRISERYAQEIIRALEAAGELVITPRYLTDEKGITRQTSNLYKISIYGVDSPVSYSSPPGRTGVHPPGELGFTPPVNRGSPETSIDTSSETSIESQAAQDAAALENIAIRDLIHAWASSWPGKPSGNPYLRKAFRADALEMHKRGIVPANVASFCAHLRQDVGRYKTSRVAFTTVTSDIDSWLEFNGLPRPDEPEPRPDKTKPALTDEQKARIAAADEFYRKSQAAIERKKQNGQTQ